MLKWRNIDSDAVLPTHSAPAAPRGGLVLRRVSTTQAARRARGIALAHDDHRDARQKDASVALGRELEQDDRKMLPTVDVRKDEAERRADPSTHCPSAAVSKSAKPEGTGARKAPHDNDGQFAERAAPYLRRIRKVTPDMGAHGLRIKVQAWTEALRKSKVSKLSDEQMRRALRDELRALAELAKSVAASM